MPVRGDEDERLTFEGVGRVITAWEHVEFALGRLYSIFKGAPDTTIMHEYGEPRIFHDRMVRLCRPADGYFVRHPSQKYEGMFCIATLDANLISKRRNDIAHSVVFDISTLPFFVERMVATSIAATRQFAAIPAYYTLRHYDGDDPSWAYTSAELQGVAVECDKFTEELHTFRDFLMEYLGV